MEDYEVTIKVKSGECSIAEKDLTIAQLFQTIGYMQVLLGIAMKKQGSEFDDIQTALFDIYMAAVADLRKQLKGGKT